jgi:RNA polymerase sigma-70 factor, ECF subfamily
MARYREEQIQIFQSWMEQFGGIPEKVSRLHSYCPTEQSDLAQEMLVQIWRSVDRFDGKCSPSTWIYRVCLNTALTWRRDAGRRRRRLRNKEALVREQERIRNGGTRATEDRIEALYAAIRKLAVMDRNLIQLSLDGLSYAEMADVTGLNESTIGSRLTRARQQLAILIEKE